LLSGATVVSCAPYIRLACGRILPHASRYRTAGIAVCARRRSGRWPIMARPGRSDLIVLGSTSKKVEGLDRAATLDSLLGGEGRRDEPHQAPDEDGK
jgi:hypothetical protein